MYKEKVLCKVMRIYPSNLSTVHAKTENGTAPPMNVTKHALSMELDTTQLLMGPASPLMAAVNISSHRYGCAQN